jgi:hypothetical protein
MDVREQIKTAIKTAGSQAKLGKATGYTQHAIWRAKKDGSVSPQMALELHKAGFADASKLRPDLWPSTEYVPVQKTGQAA